MRKKGKSNFIGAVLALSPTDLGTTSSSAPNGKPWLARKEWASASISSRAKTDTWIVWIFAIFWNLIAVPSGFISIREFTEGNGLALAGTLLPLFGLYLISRAVQSTLMWSRFGRLELQMDPYPGSVGGQIGGSVRIPVPTNGTLPPKVTLTCYKRAQSGSGSERRTIEIVAWQTSGYAQTQEAELGVEARFLFDIPDHLPQSEVPELPYHVWRVQISANLPGANLDQTFEIPVFKTQQKSALRQPTSHEHPLAIEGREQEVGKSLRISPISNGIELYSPPLKNTGLGVPLILIGMSFSGFAVFTGLDDLFGMLFMLLGAGAMTIGLYSLLVSLRVRIDNQFMTTEKCLAGVLIGQKKWPRADIEGLAIMLSLSSNKAEYFRLKAITSEQEAVTIALHLTGRDVASHTMQTVGLLTGLRPVSDRLPIQ